MPLKELSKKLAKLAPRTYAAIHHEYYAVLFPPGEPDEGARAACFDFAREHGCRIENKIEKKEIWFVKNA